MAFILRVFCLTLSGIVAGCNTTSIGPNLVALPSVEGEVATLNVRSKINPSSTIYHHLLSIDGARVALLKEYESDSFALAPGTHILGLACYSTDEDVGTDLPINYNHPNNRTTMDINLAAGDSLCIELGHALLNCSVLEEREAAYCR